MAKVKNENKKKFFVSWIGTAQNNRILQASVVDQNIKFFLCQQRQINFQSLDAVNLAN